MGTTAWGFVLILAVGLAALAVAALADRRTRLRAEGEGAADYQTASQLALSKRLLAVDEDALTASLEGAEVLGLKLADAGLATHEPDRSIVSDPWVLVVGDQVVTTRDLLRVLQRASAAGTALVVAAPGFAPEVLADLEANLAAGKLAVQALTGESAALAELAGLAGTEVVARADLMADAVGESDLGRAALAVASPENLRILSNR